ncbi:hypothetical protein [Nocardioides zeae]|uniref:Uncharacterized protein n=1 Tax=Nocardioides zeae TaxID=1457234 RepID=A0A6P0HNV3_9ACTN|nr:hypothetical protein [Nocardioides zeae]NEN80321.1 hypothetical protein [Nocardioides zeae]
MGEQTEDARGSRGPRTPRGRVVLGAAAAVVALVGGMVLAVELTASEPGPGAPAAAGATAERVDGAIAPRDGWRWIERGSVAVQVPEEWESVSLTCGGAWDGGAPAVASAGRGDYAVTADCMTTPGRDPLASDPVTDAAFPPVAEDLWRTILIVEDANIEYDGSYGEPPVPDGTYAYDGWTLTRATFGDARVNLLVRPGDEAAASAVLATVATGDLSPSGCRRSEEFGQDRDQPATGPDGVAAATTCGYYVFSEDRGGREVHAMQSARRLGQAAAVDLAEALEEAPPRATLPEVCEPQFAVPVLQVVRVFQTDGRVREHEVDVARCAVEVDGTWRALTDDVLSSLAQDPGW